MKDENRISGIGSFKLIWPPRRFMAQSVSLEGVSTHMLPSVVLVLMRTNEHTVAGVLFFLDGVFSLITFIIVAWIVFGGGHFHALGTGCLIFGCTVCAITRKKIVAMLVSAISCNVGLPDLLP